MNTDGTLLNSNDYLMDRIGAIIMDLRSLQSILTIG